MRGIFSFSIILVVLVVLLNLSLVENNFYAKIEKAEKDCIEAENSSKERTILENSIDKIIEAKLGEQMRNRNFLPASVKNEINQRLSEYLPSATKEFLNSNSNAYTMEAGGKKYGEYSFTSNEMKTIFITKKIGKKSTAYFTIPVDYSIKLIE
jgi:hypothetical protein